MQKSNQIQWGGLAGMVGGFLWALTPLREPLLGGEFPEHPVFRPYNIALLGITILLTLGLLAVHWQYKGRYGRVGTVGAGIVLIGYLLLFVGCLPAAVLSAERQRDVIMVGQDLSFLGGFIAGIGAIVFGIALRRASRASRLAATLLMISLPIGLLAAILISAAGFEDIAGLPWTILYGSAWFILGQQLIATRSMPSEQRTAPS